MKVKETVKRVFASDPFEMEEGSSAKRFKAGESSDGKKRVLTAMEIKELSLSLSMKWRSLGTVLGLSNCHLSTIDQNYNKVEEKAETMLTDWSESFEGENAYDILSEALKRTLVGRNDLAIKVKGSF